jgi:hypothetical protein
MAAILPSYQPPSEEELHTSFEEAISDRVSALRGRLSHQHQSVLYTQYLHNIDPILRSSKRDHNPTTRKQLSLHLPMAGWQRLVSLIGLALIFTLIGFDLMGLLILHMR